MKKLWDSLLAGNWKIAFFILLGSVGGSALILAAAAHTFADMYVKNEIQEALKSHCQKNVCLSPQELNDALEKSRLLCDTFTKLNVNRINSNLRVLFERAGSKPVEPLSIVESDIRDPTNDSPATIADPHFNKREPAAHRPPKDNN